MKYISFNYFRLLALFLLLPLLPVRTVAQETYVPSPENLEARKLFAERRFGIFIHWGIYSLFAQGEWFMTNANINCREYAKAAQAFYPHRFNAEQWIAAFRDAGAKYVCFTSRHHDGFSMWKTDCSDYHIGNTPYGKDVIARLADACHENDMGFHLYYSHLDWTREDYPIGRMGRGTGRKGQADWNSYFRFMNNQLTELLTRYGKVDAIWFDGMWDHDRDSVPFDWQLAQQYSLIHRLQPACLIGNNHHLTPFPGEDIQLFERDVPGENKAGLSGQEISRLPLETCQTMNGMWGYKVSDTNYKSSAQLIRLLARTAAKGANLLLNVGPQPDGSLPETALARLKEMGEWLRANGEAIYATEGCDWAAGDTVVCTKNADALFIHLLSENVDAVTGIPLAKKPKSVTVLTSGEKLPFTFKNGTLNITNLRSLRRGENAASCAASCADLVLKVR